MAGDVTGSADSPGGGISFERQFYEQQVAAHEGNVAQAAFTIRDLVHGMWFTHGYAQKISEDGEILVIEDRGLGQVGPVINRTERRVSVSQDDALRRANYAIRSGISDETTAEADERQEALAFWQEVTTIIKHLPTLRSIGFDQVRKIIDTANQAEIASLESIPTAAIEDDAQGAA